MRKTTKQTMAAATTDKQERDGDDVFVVVVVTSEAGGSRRRRIGGHDAADVHTFFAQVSAFYSRRRLRPLPLASPSRRCRRLCCSCFYYRWMREVGGAD